MQFKKLISELMVFAQQNKLNKRGQTGIAAILLSVIVAVVLFVILVAVTSIVANINTQIGTNFAAGTVERGITENGTAGIVNVATQYGLIGLVIGFGAVIALMLGFLLRQALGGFGATR